MSAFDKFICWFSRLRYLRMTVYIALFFSTSMFIITWIIGENVIESIKIWAFLFFLTLIGFGFAWLRDCHESNFVKGNVIPFMKKNK